MSEPKTMDASSSNSALEPQQVLQQAEIVFDTADIHSAIERLAQRLTERLHNKSPLVLCVMQGGLMFTGKIMSLLPIDAEFDYIHATRYGDNTSGESIEWLAHPKKNLENRTVLILDDILDEGYTLAAIEQYCRDQGAREVLSAVLLQKKHDRLKPGMYCEFVALEVDDRYVFGYGMDYKGKLRQLEKIYALQPGETAHA
jgi:hypoxanthine phosphoribosyltransferase